jgi:hypothetical protein
MSLKKAWITKVTDRIASLTLESNNPDEVCNRIYFNEMLFPNNPSDQHPLRHTINLGMFNLEELEIIKNTIEDYLENNG